MTETDTNKSGSANGFDVELDTSGLYCPEPVMMLHNKIKDVDSGCLLRVIATDPSTTRDIPKFCVFLGHDLVESGQEGEQYFYLIKKKADS